MRRLSFVISSALLLSGINLLLAQHAGGGGHVSGGHASAGHSSSSANFSTLSTRSPSAGQLVYPTPIGLQPTYSGYTGINRGAIPYGIRRGDNRGRGYAGGYFAYPYYYSGFDDYNSSSGYNQPVMQDHETANTANMLGDQVAQLSEEVNALRNQREAYQPRYNDLPPVPEDPAPPAPAVTLLLHSGKQLQLKSYAVMGQDIWDFSAQPAKRISIASIDLNASRNATEANGGEFPEIR